MKRKPSSLSAPSAARRSHEPLDPFRFGWRWQTVKRRDGTSERVQVPLTPADVLHPQEDDEIPQNTAQARDCRYLGSVLENQLVNQPDSLVLNDVLIDWGVKGLRNHSPDLSAFAGVTDRERKRKTFYVAKEGARPLLVIEIVSLDPAEAKLRDNDVVIKKKEYYQASVPLYVLIDQQEEGGPRQMIGYRRGVRGYLRMPLDSQGRLLLEPVGILLGLRDNRAVCWDAVTGQEFPDYASLNQSRLAVEAELKAAQARIQELEAAARRRR